MADDFDPSLMIPYLEKVIAMNPGNPYLQERLEKLQHPVVPEPSQPETETTGEAVEEPAVTRIPVCGISQ